MTVEMAARADEIFLLNLFVVGDTTVVTERLVPVWEGGVAAGQQTRPVDSHYRKSEWLPF